MYENHNQNLLRRSSLLIRTGIGLLVLNTVLAFFFPLSSNPTNVDFSGNDPLTLENLSFYFLHAAKIITNLVGFGSLIAGIAIYVQDKRNGTVSHFSVQNVPVNITQQTIFAFVPGLDLYASYKVKKLTAYFLIIIAIGIPSIVAVSYIFDSDHKYLIAEGIILPIAIFLIRNWSKKWNEKFSEHEINDEIK